MKITMEFINGTYLTATTRRANYTDIYFAKYSIWPSKDAYIKGCCEGVISFTNLYLGTDLIKAKEYILESAKNNLTKERQGENKK